MHLFVDRLGFDRRLRENSDRGRRLPVQFHRAPRASCSRRPRRARRPPRERAASARRRRSARARARHSASRRHRPRARRRRAARRCLARAPCGAPANSTIPTTPCAPCSCAISSPARSWFDMTARIGSIRRTGSSCIGRASSMRRSPRSICCSGCFSRRIWRSARRDSSFLSSASALLLRARGLRRARRRRSLARAIARRLAGLSLGADVHAIRAGPHRSSCAADRAADGDASASSRTASTPSAAARSAAPPRRWRSRCAISLENLPFFVVLIAAPRDPLLLEGEAASRRLRSFALGLLLSSAADFVATVAPSRYGLSACDAYSAVHIRALIVGALGLAALAARCAASRDAARRVIGARPRRRRGARRVPRQRAAMSRRSARSGSIRCCAISGSLMSPRPSR